MKKHGKAYFKLVNVLNETEIGDKVTSVTD